MTVVEWPGSKDVGSQKRTGAGVGKWGLCFPMSRSPMEVSCGTTFGVYICAFLSPFLDILLSPSHLLFQKFPK